MLAVVKEVPRPGVEVRDVEREPERPGSVAIDMVYAGICGSDVATYRWERHRHRLTTLLPVVLGHEGVGIVSSTTDDVPPSLAPGARVVVEPVLPCGRCEMCGRGRTNLCAQAIRLGNDHHGTMAQHLSVPARACYIVPQGMSDQEAALLEVAAVAVHGARRAPGVAGARCVVVGPGAVGLCMVRVLVAMGAGEIVLVGRERSAWRLEVGRAAGASDVVAVDQPGTAPSALTGHFDIAFETAGSPQALVLAAALTRTGGTVVALGGYHDELRVDYSRLIRYREIDILASRARVGSDWTTLLGMLSSGRLDLSPIPVTVVPLSNATGAFELAESGSALKVVLDCRETGRRHG